MAQKRTVTIETGPVSIKLTYLGQSNSNPSKGIFDLTVPVHIKESTPTALNDQEIITTYTEDADKFSVIFSSETSDPSREEQLRLGLGISGRISARL